MDELIRLLGRERQMLELLLFRLTEARRLLESGDDRFLSWAVSDIERAAERLRVAEVERARLVGSLGANPADADLQRLVTVAQIAGDPYGSLLMHHHRALVQLVGEIDAAAATVRRLGDLRAAGRLPATDGMPVQLELR
jgi:hypothetical protein